ncbi:fatty acid desaturase [Nitrospirillum iridis]|uniref:Omega-6 fatty acid desaturase (Delta-12 desaturase) n=1 Tax=Nitrospirillum iridis TaxID=765888 RepID=A0A7X0AXG3_9PROT|nr:fatty acid desaturase [Nitrospirillum iridis]MBB6251111.1 omega-6 fatty acid desaturase (delta-12 desaturase) [Nitrospirillum iridis]
MTTDDHAVPSDRATLRQATRAYEGTSLWRSLGQLATSVPPFLALCALMYASLDRSYLLTLALAVPAAGFFVRVFIIQHDCGHGSFFRSRWANRVVGMLCSLITLTPYLMWRRQHAGHHSHWNNLDRRFSGSDIYSGCLTLAEFQRLSPLRRRVQRILQHPLVAWGVLPPLIFLVLYRLPFDTPPDWRRERRAVHLTNLALLLLYGGLGMALGFTAVALVQGPILVIAATAGVWLFSIQHRFEQALWARQGAWDPVSAALRGSSHLTLPRLLQWFTGNIGFHHVHHLNSRIPNYRLEACHDAIPALGTAHVLTPWQGLRAWRAALWDEAGGRMVPFPKRTAPDRR